MTLAPSASARDPERVREEGRSAPRLEVAAGWGAFADTSGTGRDGPSALISLPVAMGARRKVFQWGFAVASTATWDFARARAMISAGPLVLGRVNLGSTYAMHFGIGPHATTQLGSVRAVGLVPVLFVFENAFRFWEDDRLRMIVGFTFGPGVWFHRSTSNDCAGCGGGVMAYAGMETPL